MFCSWGSCSALLRDASFVVSGRAAHRPLYLQNIYTGERLMLDRLRGTFIGSICAIAVPESFEGALKHLGANVDLSLRYIDHHYFTDTEIRNFINRCVRRDLGMIITTEKDAVRLAPSWRAPVPLYTLRIGVTFAASDPPLSYQLQALMSHADHR